MGWNWEHMGLWSMGWGWFFLALLIAGLVVLVVLLVRVLSPRADERYERPPTRSRARELLDERYARGEIDATDYEERRRHLDDSTET